MTPQSSPACFLSRAGCYQNSNASTAHSALVCHIQRNSIMFPESQHGLECLKPQQRLFRLALLQACSAPPVFRFLATSGGSNDLLLTAWAVNFEVQLSQHMESVSGLNTSFLKLFKKKFKRFLISDHIYSCQIEVSTSVTTWGNAKHNNFYPSTTSPYYFKVCLCYLSHPASCIFFPSPGHCPAVLQLHTAFLAEVMSWITSSFHVQMPAFRIYMANSNKNIITVL